jgi:hypothetical protein
MVLPSSLPKTMLTPLKRKKFDELIPLVPTSDQYQRYWGGSQDVFRRVLISVGLLIIFSLLYGRVTGDNAISTNYWGLLIFICAALGGLYWMLAPVFQAGQRNSTLRQFAYCAFWQAEVLDTYLSEEISAKKENFDNRGRMSVDYNTESFLNVEFGDRAGYTTKLQVPMRREYKRIRPGDIACLILLSNDPSFNRISKITSDAYLPQVKLWLGDYPYLRRDLFENLTRYILKRR